MCKMVRLLKARFTSTAMAMGWATSPASKSVPAKHARSMFELVRSRRLVATTTMTSAFNSMVGMIVSEVTQITATRLLYVFCQVRLSPNIMLQIRAFFSIWVGRIREWRRRNDRHLEIRKYNARRDDTRREYIHEKKRDSLQNNKTKFNTGLVANWKLKSVGPVNRREVPRRKETTSVYFGLVNNAWIRLLLGI